MTLSLSPKIQFAIDPFATPTRETLRFSMHRKLECVFPEPLPEGYSVMKYNPALQRSFSAVTRHAFYNNPEVQSYPGMKTREGCDFLINELTDMDGFQPDASFLIARGKNPAAIILTRRIAGGVFGEIQLIAVTPNNRRNGLGQYLITKSLSTLKRLEIPHANLQVVSENKAAVVFFRTMGFQVSSTGTYG